MRLRIFAALLAFGAMASHAADENVQIASQGGSSITLADIRAYLRHMPEDRWPGFLESPKRVNQMIIGILRNKQLAKQAVDLKLDQAPGVKAEIELSTQEILSTKRMEEFEKGLSIPSLSLAAKEEYTVHKKDYERPAEVVVQHILISGTNRSDAEAKALAEKVYKEAQAHPESFEQLVEKYSDDPSKVNNLGTIRDATSEKMAPAFAASAGKLSKPLEISAPVRTAFGYHVLKLIDNHPATQLPFDAVKDQIEAKLKQNYVTEQRKIFLAKLDDDTPTVNPDIAQLLHDSFVPAGTVTPSEAATGKQQ